MAAAGASAVSTGPTIDVTAVNIDPVTAPIDAPLSLCIDFSSSDSIPGAHWQIKFMVDMTNARHIIDILETPAADIRCVQCASDSAQDRSAHHARRAVLSCAKGSKRLTHFPLFCNCSEGANKVAVDVPAIDFGLLKDKPSTLANAGLLLAVLFKVRVVGRSTVDSRFVHSVHRGRVVQTLSTAIRAAHVRLNAYIKHIIGRQRGDSNFNAGSGRKGGAYCRQCVRHSPSVKKG